MSAGLAMTRPEHLSRDLVRDVPTTRLGGMPIAVLGMQESADLMLSAAESHPRPNLPLFLTSANGEVLSRYARNPDFARIVAQADLVHADGQPMVVASRFVGEHALPERVATTDLFHSVARGAVARNITFYLFGSSEEENRRAVENVRRQHPGLRIVGHSHGYLQGEALRRKVIEIDALAPDILWLALGVPREQLFVYEFGPLLTNVGLIKTSGGLFNFLSGSRTRAPGWMQRVGLEWLWRIKEEPTRLFWRYLTTNPHAMLLLLAESGAISQLRASLRRLLRPFRHAVAPAPLGLDVPADANRT
ncbi:UDP-N-acetyl-D-mannosamine transferase [Methylobacterium haplocladii]|uniref:UDP-N-acetyl-D-mannosamine transferase n=2 Tax=Methylobacterium haplocladii TaxID=1176176 RepID=A0A512IN99_9HYPH|nr:UDP-N-acetyl-D-mannosamine transferase [Methylobacterium haplocladii]GJD83191.1 N-acetylglucosaminyldiphosphoundecaprenol N-acetyl-beta-D-mannosaminyltransferase [Methylobacterium haplocladii]GLS58511.1 UDP-N-acetyl-D-mannosamine transferase [Methylobacterium haplocladii]